MCDLVQIGKQNYEIGVCLRFALWRGHMGHFWGVIFRILKPCNFWLFLPFFFWFRPAGLSWAPFGGGIGSSSGMWWLGKKGAESPWGGSSKESARTMFAVATRNLSFGWMIFGRRVVVQWIDTCAVFSTPWGTPCVVFICRPSAPDTAWRLAPRQHLLCGVLCPKSLKYFSWHTWIKIEFYNSRITDAYQVT